MKSIIQITILFLCLLLTINIFGQNPELEWTKGIEGARSIHGNTIGIDGLGNIYIAGVFDKTIDFDPGPEFASLSPFDTDVTPPIQSGDIFILKLDNNGAFVWVRQIGGDRSDLVNALKVDQEGNIYTTGSFQNQADFDPGSESVFLNSISEATPYNSDAFILKLDTDGNFIWVKHLGGIDGTYGGDSGSTIAFDNEGNLIVGGNFVGKLTIDQCGEFEASPNKSKTFFLKIDSDGACIWAKEIDSRGIGQIQTSSTNDIFINAYFTGTIDSDPGEGINLITDESDGSIFYGKLDPEGNLIWVHTFDAHTEDEILLVVDSEDNLYNIGEFWSVEDLDPGPDELIYQSTGESDTYIQKFDSEGNLLWVNVESGDGRSYIHSATVDEANNLYLTGHLRGTMDFDPGPDSLNISSVINFSNNSSSDIIVQKLSPDGNLLWVKRWGNKGTDNGSSIITEPDGNVYTVGKMTDEIYFEEDVFDFTGLFVQKINQCNNPISGIIYVNSSTISVQNTTATSYQWIDCDNEFSLIPGETNSSFTPTVSGNYAVELTENGCSTLSDCIAIISTGLDNEIFEDKINVYPNPTLNNVSISFNEIQQDLTIRIKTPAGQLLEEKSFKNTDLVELTLDVPTGLYFIELINHGRNKAIIRIAKN